MQENQPHVHSNECCCSDEVFEKACLLDPSLREKAKATNEIIKQEMRRIKQERESKLRKSS